MKCDIKYSKSHISSVLVTFAFIIKIPGIGKGVRGDLNSQCEGVQFIDVWLHEVGQDITEVRAHGRKQLLHITANRRDTVSPTKICLPPVIYFLQLFPSIQTSQNSTTS